MNYEFEEDKNWQVEKKKKQKEPLLTIVINGREKANQDIQKTLQSVNHQTVENIEIILLTNKENKEINEIIKTDNRIKKEKEPFKNLHGIFSLCSKTSQFFTMIEAGECLHKTYLETSIVTLQLHKSYHITYTDTVNNTSQKKWNYHFENHILRDLDFPVPNMVFTRDILDDIENLTIENLRTWEYTINLIEKYKAIHQSYYGFITKKVTSDLTKSNYIFYENKLFSCDIISFPYEDYNQEIISSHKESLSIFPTKHQKTNILMMIPWMIVGGADKFNLDFISLIDKEKYSITILTDHPKEYIWRQKFEKYADTVFEMASFLDRRNWPTFLEYIVETRNIDLVFITNSMAGYNLIPYLRLKYPSLPVLDYIHSVELYNRQGGYGRDSSMMTSLIDRTLFCSKNAAKMGIDLLHINSQKTNTVYIGVDHNFFAPDKKLREKMIEKYHLQDFFVIGYICRIDYPKRPLLLAEIIKKTISESKKIKFIVGGDGPLLKSLKEKIKEYELEKSIIFLGNVQNTKAFYAMCDVTLNCSIKEGLALTAYESLSMNVPVISADVGGHKELIDSDSGIIVPLMQKEEDIHNYNYTEEEISAYVRAIFKLEKNYSKYQKNTRKRVKENFSLKQMITHMQEEVDNVVNHPNLKTIENAKLLKANENLIYEFTNHYLMGSQYQYQARINEYHRVLEEPFESRIKFEGRMIPFMRKLHLEKEYLLAKDFLKSIIKIFLFPLRLLVIEIKKLKKVTK